MRLKLAHRFALLLGIFIFGFAAYGFWSFHTLNQLKVNGPLYQQIVQNKDLVADVLPPPAYIIEPYLVTLQMEHAEGAALQALVDRLQALKKDFEERHAFWRKADLSADLASLLLKQSYDPAVNFFALAFDSYVPALRSGDKEAAAAALKRMNTQYDLHRKAIDDVVQITVKRTESDEAAGQSAVASATAGQLALLAVALLAALAVALIILRRLLRSLGGEPEYAAHICGQIASGNLDIEVTVRNGDTSSLLADMQRMQQQLARTVHGIKQAVDTLGTGAAQISAGNLDLSQRTEEQSASLNQTTAAMQALTGNVRSNADNARTANELAQSASSVAEHGGVVVSQVVETMAAINESSAKIVDIISVIDGIAFQTNILALNAAVEAARAGEQGRGFAVVAGEVRNLAQRSATAAREIKALIDSSVERMASGSKLVDKAGATMVEVVESVQKVTALMADIAHASDNQRGDIEEVHGAIAQMEDVTQQNASLVEEAAAATASLQEQATHLAAAVSRFKVGGAPALPRPVYNLASTH
jgi:methyl-accepting chemotaxis protein